MPKVRPLGGGPRKTPAMRREEFNKVVLIAMAELGVRSQRQLADLLGMDRIAVNRRFNGVTDWSFLEIVKLIEVLKIGPENVVRMMGGVA